MGWQLKQNKVVKVVMVGTWKIKRIKMEDIKEESIKIHLKKQQRYFVITKNFSGSFVAALKVSAVESVELKTSK